MLQAGSHLPPLPAMGEHVVQASPISAALSCPIGPGEPAVLEQRG